MSRRSCFSLLAALALACDPDAAASLEALADPDLDPEVRAQLEAELAEEDEEHDGALQNDDLAVAPQDPEAGSCFFCPPPPPPDPNTPPVVINPYVSVNGQGNTILSMSAAASYIQTGATAKLQVPYSVQSYGPFALSFDNTGTLFRANVSGAFPVGTCRMITVTNPNNVSSAPVTLCR